jgi:hypothetical protein
MATGVSRDVEEARLHTLHTEEEWMAEHGGTLAAYIERYGSKDDPEHYGDGGEAIYAADKAKLDQARVATWRPA